MSSLMELALEQVQLEEMKQRGQELRQYTFQTRSDNLCRNKQMSYHTSHIVNNMILWDIYQSFHHIVALIQRRRIERWSRQSQGLTS
jgi:hypothetical protein